MPRTVKLICVSPDNNNKFYDMTEKGDGTFDVHYGRVGYDGVHESYPMEKWEKIYKTKTTRKDHPYKDITSLLSVETDDGAEPEVKVAGVTRAVQDVINFLQACAKGIIKQNYTVRVADVTQKQVDTAQELVDRLVAQLSISWQRETVNGLLLELYHTIPRKMKNTKLFLIQDNDPRDKFQKLIAAEQDLLDVMSGQVHTQAQTTTKSGSAEMKLDIQIREAELAEIDEIKKSTDLDFSHIGKIFRVTNSRTESEYDKFHKVTPRSKTNLLYHGSRNENWWSIINTGLKIRPANAIHTGSMFGDGLYFANKARKSIGYTSLSGSYWASGRANKAFLALYQVNVGHQWQIVHGDSSLNLRKVKTAGYDTVFAKGGADLRNDEIISYEAERCTIKYLIELKN